MYTIYVHSFHTILQVYYHIKKEKFIIYKDIIFNMSSKKKKKLAKRIKFGLIRNLENSDNAIKILDYVIELDSIFENKKRKEIYNVLSENKELNLTEISKKIKLSYRNTFNHIKLMEKVGLLNTKKDLNVQGQNLRISLSNKSYEELRKDIPPIYLQL